MSARLNTVVKAALAAGALFTAACAVGPRYEPRPPVAATRITTRAQPDSLRAFFDSLAAARTVDTVMRPPAVLPLRAEAATPTGELAWLDILRDSTLTGLVETALRQNRDIAVARARITEFRAELGVARAPLFPRLSVNATAGRNQVAFGSFPPQLFTALRTTADVAWELDFWGRTRRAVQAADADLEAQAAAERARVLSLVSDVAGGYLQLLELDQERAVAERTLQSRRSTLELARQRFQQGVISELDVKQFEAQVAVPAARLAAIGQLLAQQEHALSVLLGETPMTIPRGRSLADAASAVSVPDSLPASLLGRRPDVQQAERALAAATARIGLADAARWPAIAITGSYGTQAQQSGDLFASETRVWQFQTGLSLQLFNGGSLEQQSTAARARAEQARAQYEQTALTALREASDALVGVRATRDQAAAQQTQAAALRRALELAELRYQTGVASYLEVLDAQRGLFDAELALSQTQLRQLLAAVQLYKALGGSWPAIDESR